MPFAISWKKIFPVFRFESVKVGIQKMVVVGPCRELLIGRVGHVVEIPLAVDLKAAPSVSDLFDSLQHLAVL